METNIFLDILYKFDFSLFFSIFFSILSSFLLPTVVANSSIGDSLIDFFKQKPSFSRLSRVLLTAIFVALIGTITHQILLGLDSLSHAIFSRSVVFFSSLVIAGLFYIERERYSSKYSPLTPICGILFALTLSIMAVFL